MPFCCSSPRVFLYCIDPWRKKFSAKSTKTFPFYKLAVSYLFIVTGLPACRWVYYLSFCAAALKTLRQDLALLCVQSHTLLLFISLLSMSVSQVHVVEGMGRRSGLRCVAEGPERRMQAAANFFEGYAHLYLQRHTAGFFFLFYNWADTALPQRKMRMCWRRSLSRLASIGADRRRGNLIRCTLKIVYYRNEPHLRY